MQQTGWQACTKRAFDRVAAAAGLVVTAPVLLGVSAAIRATMGSLDRARCS
ncbi:MAG: hypothetical protein AB7P03_15280 [Kofleriaceae bacterium]